MWLEAVVTEDDLTKVVASFLPVKIFLDEENKTKTEKERWLQLFPATRVELVPGKGLRLCCRAELSWAFVGIDATAKIDELSVLITPEIVKRSKGYILELSLQLEELDFHALPDFLDHAVMKAVNTALIEKKVTWNTSETLTRRVALGAGFDPIEALDIEVISSSQRVVQDGLALVLGFRVDFVRDD